jgi:hypothetical protein
MDDKTNYYKKPVVINGNIRQALEAFQTVPIVTLSHGVTGVSLPLRRESTRCGEDGELLLELRGEDGELLFELRGVPDAGPLNKTARLLHVPSL